MMVSQKTLLMLGIVGAVVICVMLVYALPFFVSDPVHRQVYVVNEENDDGRTFTVERSDVGYGNEYDGWALLQLSPSYSFGVKFDNISIPKDAIIRSAVIELFSVGTPLHRSVNCIIYGDNASSAVNFSVAGVLNISGRNYTKSFLVWNETIPYGWVTTPSVVDILQEVRMRENWTAGHSVVFLFVTQGLKQYSSTFQNYQTGDPARLLLEWELPSK